MNYARSGVKYIGEGEGEGNDVRSPGYGSFTEAPTDDGARVGENPSSCPAGVFPHGAPPLPGLSLP